MAVGCLHPCIMWQLSTHCEPTLERDTRSSSRGPGKRLGSGGEEGAATHGEGVNDGGRPIITLTARRMKVTDGQVPSLQEPCGGGRSLPGAEK